MGKPNLDELGADWWEAYTQLRLESVWFCNEKGCAFPARQNHKCKRHGGKGQFKAVTPIGNREFMGDAEC